MGDYQLAQDLVQESLVRAYVAWPRLRDVTKAEAYLEIDEDGQPKAGVSGGIGQPGDDVKLKATTELRIRCGNAGAVELTINGVTLGFMGVSGEVVEWRITRSK